MLIFSILIQMTMDDKYVEPILNFLKDSIQKILKKEVYTSEISREELYR